MNIKQRAQKLLTCDELSGRLPDEVRAFLHDVVALEPVGYTCNCFLPGNDPDYGYDCIDPLIWRVPGNERIAIYTLGAPNDPA